jgi:ribulose 1,5-bisphosphate synthetase/thiazole synthase
MDSVKKLKWDCKKDIPLIADADIAVIGGGPGGLGAL